MKILYIITQGELGGAQKYVLSLITEAKNRNHEVALASGDNDQEGWLKHEAGILSCPTTALKYLKREISPLADLQAVWEMTKLYRQFQPDIIHLNSTKAGVIGSLAFLFYRHPTAKLIYTAHGWVFNEELPKLKKLLYLYLEKFTALVKHQIICVSEFDRQAGLKHKITQSEKLITIHNGVEFADDYFFSQAEARARLNLSPDEKVIGTVANFYPTKGLKYLITAVGILKQANLPIKTVIIGDGELRPELEQQIKELNLQAEIILAGRIENGEKYLKAFDLAVMSSVKEGLPYFALGVLSAGVPIIATNVGGLPEIIEDGVNGLLVASKNPEQLAEAIKQLLNDPELREKIKTANPQKITEQFSLRQMTEKTFAIYASTSFSAKGG
jgi:glycosyltransferase involved in cell wall biosynthesis